MDTNFQRNDFWGLAIVVCLIVFSGVQLGNCTRTESMQQLINDIQTNATPIASPGFELTDTTPVNFTFYLEALVELDEVKGFITTTGFYHISWLDYRVYWYPSDNDEIYYVPMDSSKVWVPKIILTNPANAMFAFHHDTTQQVVYDSYGHADWTVSSVIKSLCYIQIPAYPFDVHTCHLNFTAGDSISLNLLEAEITLASPDNKIYTRYYVENNEWALTGTSVEVRNETTASDLYTTATDLYTQVVAHELQLSRKPIFLVVNILLPTIFLSLLNCLVFLLPQESGERVSFSVTVMLSFAVFLNVIGTTIPKTSSPMPHLCYYVFIALVTSGVITLLAILCQRVFLTKGQEPAPRWLRKCLLMSSTASCNKISTEQECDHVYKGQPQQVAWEHAISRLDMIFFIFFFSFTIILAVVFILVMAT